MDEDRNSSHRAVRAVSRLTAFVAAGFAATMAVLLLITGYAMLTHLKLQVNDYGTYTNFLSNSAHGRPFLCFVDQSYLRTHLSFTLLLIAPLFRVWDHPFLLMVVQWLCPLLGALIVWRLAVRLKFGAPLPAVFAMLLFAYPYTQSVLTCDFHGVCLYLLLLPWLYTCLAVRRETVLVPWLLILGLREDAAFVMLPMLLYFAVRDRWRTGYVLAGLALAYGAAATLWIYPQINEITLAARRADELDMDSMAGSWSPVDIQRRAEALLWLALPAVPLLLRKRWVPIVVFPSIALLILQASGESRVHGLGVHYPAAVYPLVVLGIVEAFALLNGTAARPAGSGASAAEGRVGARPAAWLGLTLVAITLFAHFTAGRFPKEYRMNARRLLLEPGRSGRNALWAAQQLPKQGVLLTDKALAGLCGNRFDLLPWLQEWRKSPDRVDLLFIDTANHGARAVLEESLARGKFGVTYFDQRYAIAQRGADTGRISEVTMATANGERTVFVVNTAKQAGWRAFAPGCGTARYWKGRGAATPVELTLGGRMTLPPGHYQAVFRLRAEAPRPGTQNRWGSLGVVREGGPTPLAEAAIEPIAGAVGEFRYQALRFDLAAEATVEPRVRGADAPLWLDRVIFAPAQEGAP